MCNETKVNTNNPQSSPADEKNVAVNTTEYVGSIPVPFGRTFITGNYSGVYDHAAMRSKQLSSLLRLMQGEALDLEYQRLSNDSQQSLFWLALQLADEIEDTLPLLERLTFKPK